ncbi:hypothetical protein OROMI_020954 [Orobanche minor]
MLGSWTSKFKMKGGTVGVLADKLLEIASTDDKLEDGLTMALQFAHKSIWQEKKI